MAASTSIFEASARDDAQPLPQKGPWKPRLTEAEYLRK
jgi:hypothetical protein